MSPYACVDASVAVKWIVPEEDSDLALGLYQHSIDHNIEVIAPPHMPVEVVNAIRRKVVREEITPSEADRMIETFLDFRVSLATPVGLYAGAFELATRYNRPTVYDTHYVALAQLAECDFWTADQRLLNALDGDLSFVRPISAFSR